ncbi:MAG: family 1 glycosylhydrolase, partial [Leadbetterella sp.]|nr:family 1 glycosylhydrolase [Leadbetterella sp.]
MKNSLVLIILLSIANLKTIAQKVPTKQPFLWGVATCAYQVEGAYQTDGKGESKWDFLTNTVRITEKVVGQNMTGNVSINMYDRTQYLKDIQLMKELGLNSYRMSLDWSRIIPDGTGAVNEIALKHYDVLIDDLLAAGIEPFVTLYHFDYPAVLLKKGGWANPEMPNWYYNYASVVLNRFGHKVKHFITFNEPYIEFFLVENLLSGGNPNDLTKEKYMSQMQKAHAQMVVNARVIKLFHDMKLKGEIGIVLNVNPAAAWNENNDADKKTAEFQDILINGLFLDPLYKGHYPKMAMDSLAKYNPTFKPSTEEMTLIASNKPDFLGINFYAPAIVKGEDTAMSLKWLDNNPDEIKSNVGPVRPEYLYKMLMRLKTDYENPKVYITENGTGYVSEDVKVDGKIIDPMRADYIKRHVEWSLKAKSEGANLNGYMVWSGWDNFEWVSGYTKRLGLIYVDFDTQERTP